MAPEMGEELGGGCRVWRREEARGKRGLTELLSGDWLRWSASVGRPRGGYSRGDIRVTWAAA